MNQVILYQKKQYNMKKLLAVVVTSLSLTVSAQTYTHNSKVRVKTTNTAASTDNIVSIDANGELKRTTQTVSDIGGGTPTTPNIQQVLGAGNYSTLGIDFSNAGISSSNGDYYSEFYATSIYMNESVSGASFNNVSALSPLSFNISKDNGVGVSISTEMQATGVIMLEGGSLTTELNKDELRQYNGSFYGATKVTPSLTANRTYTMPDKDIEVAGLSDTVAGLSTNTVEETSATLNADYPIAEKGNEVGKIVVHRFVSGLTQTIRLYVRVTATEWVKFSGVTL